MGAFAAVINALSLLGAVDLAHAADSWTISNEQFACIAQNHIAYMEQSGDPVVIVVHGCPEPDPTEALQIASRNSGIFNVNDGDQVLILSKLELTCLSQLFNDMIGAQDQKNQGEDATLLMVQIPKEGLCEQAAKRQ